jgi:hypothetical protein
MNFNSEEADRLCMLFLKEKRNELIERHFADCPAQSSNSVEFLD